MTGEENLHQKSRLDLLLIDADPETTVNQLNSGQAQIDTIETKMMISLMRNLNVVG
jgi:hypothetical protein